jgi:hypothetical protein
MRGLGDERNGNVGVVWCLWVAPGLAVEVLERAGHQAPALNDFLPGRVYIQVRSFPHLMDRLG